MKPDSTSGVRILSRKIRVNILLIMGLFLSGVHSPQSLASRVELLMTPAMVSAIPEYQRVVVDTRPSWKFLLSHIPGAINLADWQEFTHTLNGVKGLLKDDKGFIAEKLGPLGFSPEKTIVVYGEPNDPWRTDGRFFWMFERYGFEKVALLDGGLASWKRAGKETQRGRQHPTPGLKLTPDNINLNNHTIADKALISNNFLEDKFTIIDNRTRKEFEGATPYGSPRGGHIPNAIHIHWPEFFQADGSLKTLPALNSLLNENGIRPNQEIIVYCTGGVRSAMAYFVFRYLGYKVRNYDGSWWDWSQTSFPVEANK
ncbi:MAG: sulfurtransferase [Nitrospinae bacterium]|nr:sulfurtransferase [Nitrospinota bacterium]MBL7020059.1 sulfurtransferase [Nitrospinaceae bacterium]